MATAPADMGELPAGRDLRGAVAGWEGELRADGLHLLSVHEACRPAFVAAWQTLAAGAVEPNPFFEPWFLLPSLQAFDPHCEVRLAAFFEGNTLAGLYPLRRSRDYYGYPIPHWTGWLHANAFFGAPLVAAGSERAFWHAMMEQADAHAGSALFLHLPLCPPDGRIAATLEAEALASGRPCGTVRTEERAMLFSGLSADAYFEQSMPNKKRKELRRQAKRLGEEGKLEFDRQEDATDVTAWTAEFLALERAGWKGGEGSALAEDGATCAMFRETMAGAAEAGKLERLTLRLDGKPIAMLANFLTPPGAYSFKTAYDENYARFSPGVLIQRENLALLEREDIEWCDSCAAQGHPMIERIWREKRPIASYSVGIGGKLRRAIFKQLLRRETRERKLP